MTREDKITENLGLVRACCKRFIGRGIEYDDLFQAGSMGLVKAVDGFDESKGVKLSTYAVPVILGEIRRLFRDGGSVKVSRSLKELSLKVSRISAEIFQKTGAEPSVSEIAEKLKISSEEVSEALCAAQQTISLTYNYDGEESQIEIPVSSHEESVTDKVGILQILKTLPERDREIINLRYYRCHTQQQTAAALGMSQVQVSRREKVILKELRQKLG